MNITTFAKDSKIRCFSPKMKQRCNFLNTTQVQTITATRILSPQPVLRRKPLKVKKTYKLKKVCDAVIKYMY